MHESKLYRVQVSTDQTPPLAQGMQPLFVKMDLLTLFLFVNTWLFLYYAKRHVHQILLLDEYVCFHGKLLQTNPHKPHA